jgi:uncharacterized membrane protein
LNLLISGLALFLGTHLVPSFPTFRESLVVRFQPSGYKLIFSLLSLASVALIVYGLKTAPFQPLYDPPGWGRHVTMLIMLPAVYLWLSNSVGPAPSSAQAFTAHPLNWGLILLASAHLLANGDLAHFLLFSSFLLFGVISIVSGNRRGLKPKLSQRPDVAKEAILVIIVFVVYGALVWGHVYFTGMPLIK